MIHENDQTHHNRKIDILLSTYNGSKFLHELMVSLLQQTWQDWTLLVRDDGSTDDTVAIIQDYADRYPDQIVLFKDNDQHLGPSQSFSRLLEHAHADYIMFCDQDDVWLNHKVEWTLRKMMELEQEFPGQPLLVHTDLTVVDQNLRVLSDSYWKYQKLDPMRNHFNHLLVQNMVTGCTMMINRPLRDLILPVPQQAVMHDWWIALVASMSSGIYHIERPTILYRQHNSNKVGAHKYSLRYFWSIRRKLQQSIDGIMGQAMAFQERFADRLQPDQMRILDHFVHLLRQNRLARMADLMRFGFAKHGTIKNIGFVITMLFMQRRK